MEGCFGWKSAVCQQVQQTLLWQDILVAQNHAVSVCCSSLVAPSISTSSRNPPHENVHPPKQHDIVLLGHKYWKLGLSRLSIWLCLGPLQDNHILRLAQYRHEPVPNDLLQSQPICQDLLSRFRWCKANRVELPMPKISICQSPSRTSLLLVVQHAQKLHRLLLPPPRTTLIGAVFPVLVASGSRLTHLVQPHTRIQHGQTNSYHLKTSQQVLPITIPETNRKSLSVPSLEQKMAAIWMPPSESLGLAPNVAARNLQKLSPWWLATISRYHKLVISDQYTFIYF